VTPSASATDETAARPPTALALLDHLSDMVFVVDARGTLCYANSACEAFLRRPVTEMLGTSALELVHPDDRDLAADALTQTRAKGPGIRDPLVVRVGVNDTTRSAGPLRVIELVANNLLDAPDVCGIVVCARDVTDRVDVAPSRTDTQPTRLEFSFEDAPSACAVIAPDGRLSSCNPAMTRLTGFEPDQLVGMHVAELAHPDELDDEAATAQRLLDGEVDHDTHERRLRCADGRSVWVRRTFWVVRDDQGGVQSVNCAIVDISEQRAVKEHELQLRDVLESSPELVFLTDPQGAIEYVNTRARELLGLKEGDRPQDRLAGFLTPDTLARVPEAIVPVLLADGAWTGELALLSVAGEEIPVACTVQLHKDEHGDVTLVSAIAHDIRELKRAQRLLEHQATHDVLTMLPNRKLFQELGEQALARADRDGTTVAVLFLDLDRFKHVNDTFGHPVGDLLLVEVATRLRESVRRGDVLARFGGDEFAVCCEHPAGQLEMLDLAQRLIDALSKPARLDSVSAEVGVSIGIAIGAGSRVTIDTLLRDADVALYQAKERGRGRAVIFGSGAPPDPS
jgi:diguanylate cyclase (GGDEF)-like protein/PAS domain S-box-containing protein